MTYTEDEYNEMVRRYGAQLKDKDETIAAVTAERDSNAIKCAALEQSIAQFIAADDATKDAILAERVKSERQKAREAAQAEFDAAKARLDALE